MVLRPRMETCVQLQRIVMPCRAVAAFVGFFAVAIGWVSGAAAGPRPVTFTRDVAPLLYRHCAPCHRPGESAPFALLTYADARKRAETIIDVTARRHMPPWLPGPGQHGFVGDRRLGEAEIAMFRRWSEDGLREGDAKDLPEMPQWNGGWELGEPDLVLQVPVPFTLPADGRDIYRNLVLPVPGGSNRYVRAMQFRPGSRAVHHAFLLVDKSGNSRAKDAKDPEPGFPGLDLPEGTESPGGHFLSWQPGRGSYRSPLGLAWTLPAGADVVVQLHLQPIGRPERVAPLIGLYFTDRPPEREFFKLGLTSLAIDIPPGAADHVVEDSFTLPVGASVLGINPHCHYLGKDLRGFAVLPDGTTNHLLHIPRWDFNWQGDYRYAQPVELPRGTRLVMRFTFDNSASNPRNPDKPPKRVRYGMQTTDEMAELWLQLLPKNPGDLEALREAYAPKALREIVTYQEYRLRLDPDDAHAHGRLGVAKLHLGDFTAGAAQLRTAIRLDPADDYAHFNLGIVHQEQKDAAAAEREFAEAVRLNPKNAQAHGSLGIALGERGDLAGAERHLREALRLAPDDSTAREVLDQVVKLRAAAKKP